MSQLESFLLQDVAFSINLFDNQFTTHPPAMTIEEPLLKTYQNPSGQVHPFVMALTGPVKVNNSPADSLAVCESMIPLTHRDMTWG